MREIWRVLSASGRLLIVAPNRAGLWARFERTPFGHGRPYSPNQLSLLLRDTMFTPIGAASGLFVPPSRWRMVLSAAPAWENIGSRWFPRFAGVVIAEATKQIYAAQPETKARRRRAICSPSPPPSTAWLSASRTCSASSRRPTGLPRRRG